ncbi:MAG: putative ABC transporter permease [Faecalibacillus sp.]
MKKWLILAFIFSIGSFLGWILELFFRRFFSHSNPERKWVNPGFLVGPCLPLYGFSLCILYLLAEVDVSFIQQPILQYGFLFICMAICITGIEYIAGLIFIKGMHVKLWDYSKEKFNIQGIVCLKFTIFWYILSAFYVYFIHPNIIESIEWLAGNLSFSFFIGIFYGILIIDVCYSLNILKHIQKIAKEKEIVVQYEQLRTHVATLRKNFEEKERFMFSLKLDHSTFKETLKHYIEEKRD